MLTEENPLERAADPNVSGNFKVCPACELRRATERSKQHQNVSCNRCRGYGRLTIPIQTLANRTIAAARRDYWPKKRGHKITKEQASRYRIDGYASPLAGVVDPLNGELVKKGAGAQAWHWRLERTSAASGNESRQGRAKTMRDAKAQIAQAYKELNGGRL